MKARDLWEVGTCLRDAFWRGPAMNRMQVVTVERGLCAGSPQCGVAAVSDAV